MIALLLLSVLAADSIDERRSAWRYRVEVTAPAGAENFAVLALPPEVSGVSQPDGTDWRLVSAEGDEIPFVNFLELNLQAPVDVNGSVIDTRAAPKKFTQWTVDFVAPRDFASLDFTIDAHDFTKAAKIEGALLREGPWQTLAQDANLFDVAWNNTRVHHTQITLEKNAHARYVRVTVDDKTSPPIDLRGISEHAEGKSDEERFAWKATLGPRQTVGDTSVYHLTLPGPVAFNRLVVESSTPTFSRDVRLEAVGAAAQRGTIYRYAKGTVAGEHTSLPFVGDPGREWQVVIEGDATAPLANVSIGVVGPKPRIVFPRAAGSGPWQLYFGNAKTRVPHYDVDAFRATLGEHPQFATASIGSVNANPRFAVPPPLRFVANVGAALDVEHYRLARELQLDNGEEIYAVDLLPEEVGAARDDLADVRIVDKDGKQIPYVRADAWQEKTINLPLGTTEPGRTERHVFQLPHAPPIAGLLLNLNDPPFFSRTVRVIDEASGDRRDRHVLLDTRFIKEEDRQTPPRLSLDGRRHAALVLEIENGDNTPLPISNVQALVRVPRLAFKVKDAKTLTLLAGNAAAAPADYDIATLRQQVLAYAALPVISAASTDNPLYRREAADYFRDAPPVIVIWGALIALVAVLLALTVRLVRRAT